MSLPYTHLLGTLPDREIARQHGVPQKTVWNERLRRGIPAHVPPPKPAEWHELVGKVSDNEIARRFKVGPNTVRKRRVALGLPPAPEGRLRPGRGRPKREKPTTTVRERLRVQDVEPPPTAKARPEVVAAPVVTPDCTFADDCRCRFCRPKMASRVGTLL